MYRLLIWLLNFGASYMVLSPLTIYMVWVPMIGYLLQQVFLFSTSILACYATTVAYLLFAALTWFQYRPVVSFLILLVAGTLVGLLTLGTPLDKDGAYDVYMENGWA